MVTLAHLNVLTIIVVGFVIFWEISFARGSHVQGLTIEIPPRHEECFFERIERPNRTLMIHYSVIASKGGDYDVNFQVSDSAGRPMVTEFRKTVSQIILVIKETGDYKLCFDNTFSHFSTKTIAFEITLDKRTSANWESYDPNALEPEGMYDVQIKDIQDNLKRVRIHINEIQTYQDNYRKIEARDRSLTESNFVYVNICSAINSLLLLAVGIIQVVLMKSFFDNNKTLLQITFGLFEKFYRNYIYSG